MNRRERAAYAKALASMKRWAREDRPENWTAEEWRGLVERVSSQKPVTRESARFTLLRPLVSVAAALVVLVWAAVFLIKPRPADLSAQNTTGPVEVAAHAVKDFQPLPEIISPDPAGRTDSTLLRPAAPLETRRLLASAASRLMPNENKPVFTWISSETGLKIVWFTNNNLKLEDLP